MFRLFRVLLDPEATSGGGDSTPTPTPTPTPTNGDKAPDLVKAVEGLLSKHGDAASALRVLLSENHGYRDQLRELKGRLPADGSVILTGDDAKAWGQFRTLGKFEDVETRLKERDTLDGQVKAHAHEKHMANVGRVADMKPSVLTKLAEGLTIEVHEEKGKDGKAVEVAVVKGEGDAVTPLADYAAKHWEDYLDALKPKTKTTEPPRGTPPRRFNPPPAIGADGNANDGRTPRKRLASL